MIIFSTTSPNDQLRRVVVLLGAGLVGSAVADSLRRRYRLSYICSLVNWHDLKLVRMQLSDMVARLDISSISQLDWVWAAGRAGFAATPAQVSDEILLFRVFLDVVEKSRASARLCNIVRIHLISSAGGLFEGTRQVGLETEPNPRRPYGELKLRQEELAQERLRSHGLYIYRLSSVYGLIRPRHRIGLISVLITNTLRQKITYFNGRLDTLRDYVWAGDIGEFITNQIQSNTADQFSIFLLASGQPSSILQIRDLVQRATQRQTYIRCMAETTNAEHITFMPSALPIGWRSTSIAINIRRIAIDALCTGSVMPQPH